MKKNFIMMLVILSTPFMLNAGGIGVYIPYNPLGTNYDGSNEDSGESYDYDVDYKAKPGFGIAFSTNINKEKVYGYQLALEYTQPEADYPGSKSSEQLNLINNFEFGVLNKKKVRVWIGPKINIGYKWFDDNGYKSETFNLGLTPLAVGVHVALSNRIGLSVDFDYIKLQAGTRNSSYGENDSSSTFTETVTGPTIRLGVFFRFGESSTSDKIW
jgi:hypothetical protein